MINDVKADFVRYCQIESGSTTMSFFKKLRVWSQGYGLQVLATQRFYRWSLQGQNALVKACKFPVICVSFLLYKITGKLYDIAISHHAQIGPGCYIGHFGGIRIGPCHIGKLCNINHQVTIGDFVYGESIKHIVIGERVWIGAHSEIKRGVCIGNGVVISAGTIVSSDIVDRVLVAGPSARVLKRDFDNNVLLGLAKQER